MTPRSTSSDTVENITPRASRTASMAPILGLLQEHMAPARSTGMAPSLGLLQAHMAVMAPHGRSQPDILAPNKGLLKEHMAEGAPHGRSHGSLLSSLRAGATEPKLVDTASGRRILKAQRQDNMGAGNAATAERRRLELRGMKSEVHPKLCLEFADQAVDDLVQKTKMIRSASKKMMKKKKKKTLV
ncbi:hypothetical protein T484DRAFT_1884991 [Baffinella frigidus]|nr:hypothetical protein T484DRAFT_1884991 [Cryptophyta sp. CCMP2293]